MTPVGRSLREWHGGVRWRRDAGAVPSIDSTLLPAAYSWLVVSERGRIETNNRKDETGTLDEERARGWRRSKKEREVWRGWEREWRTDRRWGRRERTERERTRERRDEKGEPDEVLVRVSFGVQTERVLDPKEVTDYREGLFEPKKLARHFQLRAPLG